MPFAPATPGVYIERADAVRPDLAPLRTDIVGFVGIAERGPLNVPVAIDTMRQFETVFGNYIGGGYLAYCVRAFFENGGARCRVVRVASVDAGSGAAAASLPVPAVGSGPGITVSASSPGSWGNALSVAITPAWRAETLTVPGLGTTDAAIVETTSGFVGGSLVRLAQPGAPDLYRIVAAVDTAGRRLFWINPEPARRGLRERPLTGFDNNQPILVRRLDYDFLVRQSGRLVAVFSALSLVPGTPRYLCDVLALPDYTRPQSAATVPPPIIAAAAELAPDAVPTPLDVQEVVFQTLAGGSDGLAALRRDDFIGEAFDPLDGAAAASRKRRGLAALADTADVSVLAVPDILIRPELPLAFAALPAVPKDPCAPCPAPDVVAVTPLPPPAGELPPTFGDEDVFAVQAAMVAQCEALRDRIALIDPPFSAAGSDRLGVAPLQAWASRFDTAFAALYFPWVAVSDPLAVAPTRLIPPSGHVAGQFAATDLASGVHHAAANVVLAWAQDLSVAVDGPTHGLLNSRGINVIRAAEGRPPRILGARTLSSDPTFRFVPVRRLISMLRRALDIGTQWAVFEPNNAATRLTLFNALNGFLGELWQRGALAGATADAGFQVRCDEINNPPTRRALGELHADIAVAPAAPFEFIILRLGRQGQTLEIAEGAASLAVGGA
jgi:phage tail sheath protein FI